MGGSTSQSSFEYTVPVIGSERPGESPIYVSPLAKPYLSIPLYNGAQTLYESFKSTVNRFASTPFLGTRETHPDGTLGEFHWKTFAEISDFAAHVGYGLASLGLTHKNDEGLSFIGLYSKNREEWIISDIACFCQSITSVPLYDTQQAESIEYIVDQTHLPAIFCAAKQTETLLRLKQHGLATLRFIFQFEQVSEELKQQGSKIGVEILSINEVASLGKVGEDQPPTPNTVYTICYTSGTTGRSKGAVITHANMIATLAGIVAAGFVFDNTDVFLSYLPLAHMLERILSQVVMMVGASIGFYGGDILKLREDLAALSPTVFASVPRLYNRFHDLIQQQFAGLSGVKRMLLNRAMNAKLAGYEQGHLTHNVWDKLVFAKVKSIFGGKVRLMVTGSAPISGEVLKFLRIAFSSPIVEGYGQTETCAASFLTSPTDLAFGHIGGPIPTVEAKLVDVPDMNYLSTDLDENGQRAPRGELCMRGPTIFKGYYKSPEQTAEAIDDDGWLHSGDIAIRRAVDGGFKLIDRKKNFFKLAQGEYVAAEKIELVYQKSFLIAQIFVYGDSFQSYLIAVVVPDEQYIRKVWCEANGVSKEASFEEICRNPKLKEDIIADMNIKGKEDKLLGFEVVKKIHIEHQAWTTEDLLTPTQKLMRFHAKNKYLDIMNQLYTEPL